MNEPARAPGRPRSAQADAAILSAAIELLPGHGFEAMSIGRLAERAGVGKATISRRWGSKTEVVVAALGRLSEPPPIPDTDSTAGDLLELGRRRMVQLASSAGHLPMPRIAAELRASPELRAPFLEHVVAPARARLHAIFERGIARGELRADLDPDAAIDLVAGAVVYRVLMGDELERIVEYVPAVIDTLMKGISR